MLFDHSIHLNFLNQEQCQSYSDNLKTDTHQKFTKT